MRFLSIAGLLQAITGVMATGLVVTFAVSAERAWERRVESEKAIAAVSVSRDLFYAMQSLRFERGTVNAALTAPEMVDAETQRNVAALRVRSEAALQSAFAKLKNMSLGNAAAGLSELRNNREAVDKLRQDVDAALRRPKGSRAPELSKSWIAGVGQLASDIGALVDELTAPIDRADPIIAELTMITKLAWEARSAAGLDRLTIGAAIAEGNGLSLEKQQQLTTLAGRIDLAWNLIGTEAHESDVQPRLRAAFEDAQQSYFIDFAEKRKPIVADLVAGKKPSISGRDWVRLSNPGLAALMTVANVSFELTEEDAAQQAEAATLDFYLKAALAIASLAVGLFAVAFVVTRITQPLAAITGEMQRVADGDLARAIPFANREDEVGRLARALAVFRDNTAAKLRMEKELQHARKLEALGTLAGGLAHELNNTLVPVLGLAKLTIKRLPEGSREQSNLVTILMAGEKARDLVDRIVAFSRKEMPVVGKVDLAALARDSLNLLRASLPSGITVEEWIGPVPPMAGDPGQLSQMLINLVMNAVQATKDERGTVTVRVTTALGEPLPHLLERTAAPVLRVSVSDRGCGMTKAVMARMFEPFFSTKEVGTGTGLGLSVVHGIVTQHGGRIAVESEPGKGTRIDIFLPAATEQDVLPSEALLLDLPPAPRPPAASPAC